jgi:hypothetical protein
MVRRDFALECTHEAEGPEVAEPARGHCRRFCCRRPDRLRRLHDDQDEHPEHGRRQRVRFLRRCSGRTARTRPGIRANDRDLSIARTGGHDRRRSGKSFPLPDTGRGTGHPLRCRGRCRGVRLVGHGDRAHQAGMARLVSATGNAGAQARAAGAHGAIAKRHRDERRSGQSDRRPRDVSVAGQEGHALPYPRHQRAVDYRHQRVVRLHPPDNEDVTDLYNRTPVGTKVIVLATAKPTAAAQ